MALLRLPFGVKELFDGWLERHLPERREKVIHQIRSTRGGRLNDSRFGSRMRGSGKLAEQAGRRFEVARRRAGLERKGGSLSTAAFRRPPGPQLELF